MKTILLLSSMSLFILFNLINTDLNNINTTRTTNYVVNDISQLKGNWILDLSPENTEDDNFAKMTITEVGENSITGYFYRDGVKIREGRINTQRGIIYVALVSGDNSGIYNTSFFYKDGMLYGSTHSVDKDFLAVWIATKEIE